MSGGGAGRPGLETDKELLKLKEQLEITQKKLDHVIQTLNDIKFENLIKKIKEVESHEN